MAGGIAGQRPHTFRELVFSISRCAIVASASYMTMKTKKPKLIDQARAVGISKRTLQSWGELGCPIDGTPNEIRHWRATTDELEQPRWQEGRKRRADPPTMAVAFDRLLAAIRQRAHEIADGDDGSPQAIALWDAQGETIKRFIRALWSRLPNNIVEDDEHDDEHA